MRNAENSADNGRKSRQSINNNYDIFDGVQHQQPRQCFYHVAQNSHFKGSLNLCNGIVSLIKKMNIFPYIFILNYVVYFPINIF